jgi:hypothetical protein
MNAFLAIIGVLIVGLLIALWAVKKFNVKTKVYGIPLQYVLDIALVLTGITAVIVIKTVLGNNSTALKALLMKLNIMKAQNNINIANDEIKTKTDAIISIDQQIKNLQPATQQKDIDNLIVQQNAVKQQLQDLNQQKQTHISTQTTLEQQIKNLGSL